jgi:hypothetical protein
LPAPAIFHRDASGDETSSLNPNIADENGESSRQSAKNAKMPIKMGKNIFHEGVTGLRAPGENAKIPTPRDHRMSE